MHDGANHNLGHNNPPDALDDALAPFGDFITEAESWLDGEAVTSEGQMKAVDALAKQIKAAEKAVLAVEEAEAKPLYHQWQEAKARFKPTLEDLGRLKKGLASIVNDFKKKLAAEKAAEERKARAEADRKRREAEQAARQASASDIEAQRAAAEAQREAEEAQRQAVAAGKDQVKGLRKVTLFEVKDHRAALNWIATNDRDALTAFIDEYVRRNHKAKNIAGVDVWEDKAAF